MGKPDFGFELILTLQRSSRCQILKEFQVLGVDRKGRGCQL